MGNASSSEPATDCSCRNTEGYTSMSRRTHCDTPGIACSASGTHGRRMRLPCGLPFPDQGNDTKTTSASRQDAPKAEPILDQDSQKHRPTIDSSKRPPPLSLTRLAVACPTTPVNSPVGRAALGGASTATMISPRTISAELLHSTCSAQSAYANSASSCGSPGTYPPSSCPSSTTPFSANESPWSTAAATPTHKARDTDQELPKPQQWRHRPQAPLLSPAAMNVPIDPQSSLAAQGYKQQLAWRCDAAWEQRPHLRCSMSDMVAQVAAARCRTTVPRVARLKQQHLVRNRVVQHDSGRTVWEGRMLDEQGVPYGPNVAIKSDGPFEANIDELRELQSRCGSGSMAAASLRAGGGAVPPSARAWYGIEDESYRELAAYDKVLSRLRRRAPWMVAHVAPLIAWDMDVVSEPDAGGWVRFHVITCSVWAERGDLFGLVGGVGEAARRGPKGARAAKRSLPRMLRLLGGVARLMEGLEVAGVVLPDLKLENIVVTRGWVLQLIDLGGAVLLGEGVLDALVPLRHGATCVSSSGSSGSSSRAAATACASEDPLPRASVSADVFRALADPRLRSERQRLLLHAVPLDPRNGCPATRAYCPPELVSHEANAVLQLRAAAASAHPSPSTPSTPACHPAARHEVAKAAAAELERVARETPALAALASCLAAMAVPGADWELTCSVGYGEQLRELGLVRMGRRSFRGAPRACLGSHAHLVGSSMVRALLPYGAAVREGRHGGELGRAEAGLGWGLVAMAEECCALLPSQRLAAGDLRERLGRLVAAYGAAVGSRGVRG